MSRPKAIAPVRKVTLHLPEDRVIRVEMLLTSTVLGKIPQGAWSRFLTERIDEYFARHEVPQESSNV